MPRIVTIDFETYYDSHNYTLSKMGPVSYIRDPSFTVLCVGIRIDRGPTRVYDVSLARQALLDARLDDPDTWVVGHNIAGFDALILSEHYGIYPANILDTIALMHWLGISRVSNCTHKALTALLGHGVKQAGTVVSDGKRRQEDFTAEEWAFFTQYCADDVTQCSENAFTMLAEVKSSEPLMLMNLTAHFATEPAFIPMGQAIDEYITELDASSEQARMQLASFLHFSTVADMLKALRSRIHFPQMLKALGVEVPMKMSPKQGKLVPAISKGDVEFTKLADSSDPRVALLVRTRLEQNASLLRARADKLASPLFRDRPVPILLCAYKAHTGRYTAGGSDGASDGLNFQNFNKRDPEQLVLRRALHVPAGQTVVACDSSQIEARILAWVSEHEDLVAQFREGRDPYAEMAAKIFHEDATEIHAGAKNASAPKHDLLKMHRNIGKLLVLSAGYGVGAGKLSDSLLRSGIRLSPDDAQHMAQATEIHKLYRAVNPAIVAFWRCCDSVLKELVFNPTPGVHGKFGRGGVFTYGRFKLPCLARIEPGVALPNGFVLWYPGLRQEGREYLYAGVAAGVTKKIYGGLLAENVCQSLAFQLLAWQACRMYQDGVAIRCNIHDAWIAVCPDDRAEDIKQIMLRDMASVPAWLEGFPVGCEAEIGKDFTIA